MSHDQDTTKRNKREHLTLAERKTIERMLRTGANKAEIARALYRDISTIKREIKRGSVEQRRLNPYVSRNPKVPEYLTEMRYYHDVGQREYERNRQNCGRQRKLLACRELVSYVEERILGKEKWSPDAAIGRAKQEGMFPGQSFSTRTFYHWIDEGLVNVKNIDLHLKVRRKVKSKRSERKRVFGKSIEERPIEVEAREEFGHWEGDGMVGKGQKGHLLTLVERKCGIGFLFNVGDKKSYRIVDVLDCLESRFGKKFREVFKTLTFDNGSEFSSSEAMESSGRTKVYYAHPYSSYERGTNENWNGIVRRFIPKGRSLATLNAEDIVRIEHYINTLPRKRFNYKTPLELWEQEINAILAS